jgi:hypothetical protein
MILAVKYYFSAYAAEPGALRLGPPKAADGVADAAPKFCAT